MRELKFRAWDKDTAKYTDGVGELYVDILEVGTKTYRIEQMCPGRYTIELFTGLKDKNGKEIYEGDVVRVVRSYGYGFLPKGAKAKIEFDEKELCYKLRGQGEFRLTAKKELEVIGNIHENPELCGEEE